jgi:hypothetical protein
MKYSAKNEIQCKKVKYSAKNEIQCKKVKYSAKSENNTKTQTFTSDEISNMAGVFSSGFSNKIVYIKIICFACDLRMAHAHDCMMHTTLIYTRKNAQVVTSLQSKPYTITYTK